MKIENYRVAVTARYPRRFAHEERERLIAAGFTSEPRRVSSPEELTGDLVATLTLELKGMGMRDAVSTTVGRLDLALNMTMGMEGFEWQVTGVTATQLP